MKEFSPYLLFLIGFIMIIKGSDWFIDATIWIAKVLKVPNIIIGATLVSICTTLPEAMVSGSSAINGNASIAFGNALGSIACNTGFILGLTILLSRPEIKQKKKLSRTGLFLVFLLSLLTVFSLVFGEISRITGFMFLGILLLYLYNNVKDAKMSSNEIKQDEEIEVTRNIIIKNIILFAIGITFTIIGANLLVTNGEKIAKMLGVPDIIIGVTLTAFGTSLPELVTAITAIVKKAHDISIGNVLGANILNIILVIGLSSSILPFEIQPSWLSYHIPFVFAIVLTLVAFTLFNKKRFRRWNGVLMIATYFAYIYFLIF
ncbi:calcium/sodium antiporter [Vallitalea sp.]|jgi:cation:H+ antiporter|uniref:calcium/sodium antiporter n=1 Tax=Vallitalea sp. TaxID=1882829 RepID=UPI0025CE3967|nr:calcium/sodium antiporter [Vallitalea sp.]MCT4687225.1 calcium/sodium antiporter [Vallitalea sp.]